MGGSGGTAADLLMNAAAKGQHFVTANKALVAATLPSIETAFLDSRAGSAKRAAEQTAAAASAAAAGKRRVRRVAAAAAAASAAAAGPARLGYEASVAGGIPIIRALRDSLVADQISSVRGILNGTTNFILTKMANEGLSYETALEQAQKAGFAEADPTADVEGHDARNKLVILAKLAYGVWVPPSDVSCEGITVVRDIDVEMASEMGYGIKLLGVAETVELEEKQKKNPSAEGASEASTGNAVVITGAEPRRALDLFVSPSLVGSDSALAKTSDAQNFVVVDSDSTGITTYAGAGAGRFPTANSVLADMVSIATGSMGPAPFPRPAPRSRSRLVVSDGNHVERTWYVRGPTELVQQFASKVWDSVLDFSGSARGGGGESGKSYDALLVMDRTRKEMAKMLKQAERRVSPGTALQRGEVVLFPVDESAFDE